MNADALVAAREDLRLRTGAVAWFTAARHMLRFEWATVRPWAGLTLVVQIMMSVGMAVMYGFFYPEVTDRTAMLITTGVPTLALVPLGFVLVPAAVSQRRIAGTFDFIWSLPVPRSAQVVATFTLNSALALPGTVLALLAGVRLYGVELSLSWVLLPAVVLSAVMCVAVGYGIAMLVGNPLIINLLTNATVFLVLLFTPIVYPAANLPEGMQRMHEVLPFYPMAQVVRAGLTDGVVTNLGASFLTLAVWAAAGTAVTTWAVTRRP